jgi:hypothetical protein
VKNMAKDIQEMALELGIKKENLDFGLKQNKEKVEESIKKAYSFLKRTKN